jgi:hypothetical protein
LVGRSRADETEFRAVKATVDGTTFRRSVSVAQNKAEGECEHELRAGKTQQKGKITMNLRIRLTVAVLLAGALVPALRAGSLSTQVIGMFPQNAGEFAYVDLRQARSLIWFPQLQEQLLPGRLRQFEQFLASAGVDPNSQVEELAWALVPTGSPAGAAQNDAVRSSEGVVGVALGAFWPEKIEAYFKAQQLAVVKVRDYSLYPFGSGSGDLFFCFIDSNTAIFGQRKALEKLMAVRDGEEQSLLSNAELAPLISEVNGSGMVWAVLSAPYARLAMQQLAPQTTEFPQAQQIASKLRALTIEITAGSSVQAYFEAVCASPDEASALAALLQAGLLYQRYQVTNSNPHMAAMLDQAEVTPSGDRLDVTLGLTDDQAVGLIQLSTFVLHL